MNLKKNSLHGGVALSAAILLGLSQAPTALAADSAAITRNGTVASHPSGALITPAYRQARAFLGTTPDEIQAKFSVIQEMNFSKGDAKQIVSHLSDRELADIAYFYRQSAPTGDNQLLMILAQKLDSSSLVRVAKAFGSNATRAAVKTFAPKDVQEAFVQQLAITPNVPTSEEALPSALAFGGAHTMEPNHFMTIPEIYLDFRTAPVGSLGVGAALTETAIYSGTSLMAAWGVGYEFGTVIHDDVIEPYAPQWDDVIGGTIQSAIEDVDDALDEWDQGNFERGVDDLFNTSLGNTGDYTGDWDVGNSYEFYEVY